MSQYRSSNQPELIKVPEKELQYFYLSKSPTSSICLEQIDLLQPNLSSFFAQLHYAISIVGRNEADTHT